MIIWRQKETLRAAGISRVQIGLADAVLVLAAPGEGRWLAGVAQRLAAVVARAVVIGWSRCWPGDPVSELGRAVAD